MKTLAHWQHRPFDPRLLIVLVLSLVIVACNSGGTSGY
jgi:hypothetical protein